MSPKGGGRTSFRDLTPQGGEERISRFPHKPFLALVPYIYKTENPT